MKKTVLVLSLVIISGCTETLCRYEQPYKDDDKSLGFLYEPQEDWRTEFGPTERTVIMYNISRNRKYAESLEGRIKALEDKIGAMETQEWLNEGPKPDIQ